MTEAMNTTKEQAATINQTVTQQEEKEVGKAEICFGALMGIAAIAGMWAVVSMLISYFVN